jgi:hypothetical protein
MCELMSILMHHGPRDKCGSVGSGSHQLTDKVYTREVWNVVIAFIAGFLLAWNKERQRRIFRKNGGAALKASTTNGSGITASNYN